MQPRTDKHILGIDVSRYQAAIDWQKMRAAGVRFVWIKATEGVTYRDPMLERHSAGARQAGMKIGFYHFARIYNDPRREVEHLLDAVRHMPHELPYALDIEKHSEDFAKHRDKYNRPFITFFCRNWLEHFERLTGETPIIYTNTAFAREYLDASFARWPVWIAHYGVKQPGANGIWDRWAAWQYTDKNDGLPYAGELDVNVMEPDFLEGGWRRMSRFVDVPAGHWAEKEILKAAEAGILKGVAEDRFDPNGPVTRAQLAVVLNRLGLLERKEGDGT